MSCESRHDTIIVFYRRRQMRRKILVLVALVLFIAASVGTAFSQGNDSGTISIRVMTRWTGTDSNAPALQQVIQDFNAANPDIEIIDESIADSGAYNTKLAAGIATKQPPHIFQVWSPVDFAKNGALLDMKPYFDADASWRDGFIGGIIDAVGKFPGLPGLYVVPMETNYEPFYYNTELFAKAGIAKAPQKWSELIADVKKLNAAGITPMGAGARDNWRIGHILNGISAKRIGLAKLFDLGTGKTKFTDPAIVATFKLMKELVDAKAFDKNMAGLDYGTETTNFFAEKSAMVYNGTWFVGNVEGSAIKGKIKTFLMPAINGYESLANNDVLYSGGFACSNYVKSDAEKKAMIKVMKYLSGKEGSSVFATVAKTPAVRKDIDVDVKAISPLLAEITEIEKGVKYGVTGMESYAYSGSVNNLMGDVAQALVLGLKTPEQCAKMLQDALDKDRR
jgi:raffinose/stachyose/melibiose transport system substrate-binding protein